jgi:hypothetical protein
MDHILAPVEMRHVARLLLDHEVETLEQPARATAIMCAYNMRELEVIASHGDGCWCPPQLKLKARGNGMCSVYRL